MSTLNVDDINVSGRVNLFRGADVASATTVDVAAATGNLIHITGTTEITGFSAAPQAGIVRTVIFDGILSLVHNAPNFLQIGNASMTTEAGDVAMYVADTTSIWRCISYVRQADSRHLGVVVGKQVLTAGVAATYTPTSARTKYILVQLFGAGGAGGSATNVAGSANGGGGAGGYAELRYALGAGQTSTYTIGVGGVANAGAAGDAGGDTTFSVGSTTVTAYGGSGGTFMAGTAAIKFTPGGLGGVISTNGDVNGAGVNGAPGMTSTVATVGCAGSGASTALGGGGVGGRYITAAAVAGAAAVANTGSGGGGGGTGTTTVAAGGAGADGVIIITEFI